MTTNVGQVSQIPLGIIEAPQSDPFKVSPWVILWLKTELLIFNSVRTGRSENRMRELVFKTRTNKIWKPSKVWPIAWVKVSRFSHHQKLVQANNEKKLWASNLIMFLCRKEQRFIYWSCYHSWTMGLNFGDIMLS